MHIDDLQIVVVKDSLRLCSLQLCGVIYVKYNNIYFPSNQWDDFVVSMINNLIMTIGDLMKSETMQDEVGFLDGPFVIEIEKKDQFNWLFKFIDEHDDDNRAIVFSVYLDPRDFLSKLIEVAVTVVKFCKETNTTPQYIHRMKLLIRKYTQSLSAFDYESLP